MFPGLTAIDWISVTSFSISVAALLARFLVKTKMTSAKSQLLIAVVVFALTSGAVSTFNTLTWSANVERLADKIYIAIGNQEKTTEQILLELGPVEEKSFAAALDLMKRQNRLKSRVEQIVLFGDRQTFVRLWRAIPE